MKVADLIVELQKLDPELDVYSGATIPHSCGCCTSVKWHLADNWNDLWEEHSDPNIKGIFFRDKHNRN